MKAQPERPNITLRVANESHLVAINDIYNHYVLHSTCTYQEEIEPIENRRHWLQHHGEPHPIIVAELDHQVVGWGSLSPYHQRSAYRRTVENSVYVHHNFHRRGIGSLSIVSSGTRSIAPSPTTSVCCSEYGERMATSSDMDGRASCRPDQPGVARLRCLG